MTRHLVAIPLATLCLFAACSNGTSSGPDDDGGTDGSTQSSSSSGHDGSSGSSSGDARAGDVGGSSSGSDDANSSSGDDGSSSDSGTCTIGVDFGDPTCDACAEAKCCAVINACFEPSGSDCDQLDTCLLTCLNEAGPPTTDAGAQCGSNCFAAHAASKNTWAAYDTCVKTSCKTECGG